jgi:hypothetical protein
MRSASPDFSTKKRSLPMKEDPTEPEEKLRYSTSLRERTTQKQDAKRDFSLNSNKIHTTTEVIITPPSFD